MKLTVFVAVTFLLSTGAIALAQTPAGTKIVPGSKAYIEKMDGFENYLAAAFAKKKVQLAPVAERDQADYVISGTSEDKTAGWAKIVFYEQHSF